MRSSQRQILIEIVLYIINKMGGIDYYHLFKILYFANQRSLVEWGHPMITDKFCALPHGPVPTELYSAIKGERSSLSGVRDDVQVSDYYLLPKRGADMDYISLYNKEVLDECIAQYGKMNFFELERTSHTQCWEMARAKRGNHMIELADIARDGGASEEFIEYINDTAKFDEVFGD